MAEQPPLVLYVDDDVDNTLVFEQHFAARFPVRAVQSGRAALEVLAAQEVAVVITDQRMPEMSGNELLKRVKELHPAVVRAVITAYSDLDPILQAVNEGLVARYVIKPWVRTELEQMLGWALDAYRLGKESSETRLRLLATERLVTLGTITATIFHDINQPLTVALVNNGYLVKLAADAAELQSLLDSLGNILPERHRRLLAKLATDLPALSRDAFSACESIKDIVAGIKNLSSPRQQTKPPPCDPWPAVNFAMMACRTLARPLLRGLTYAGREELPKVTIGSTELIQVLINLTTNAIHAAMEKQPRGNYVRIECRDDGPLLELAVLDDGVGMSEELMAKIGHAFFSTRAEGTGLGLHHSRRLVEGAGGSLRVESQPGIGTAVRFTLVKAGALPTTA